MNFRSLKLAASGAETGFGAPAGTIVSKRLDQGAWTDVSTEFPLCGLVLSALSDGGGGDLFGRALFGG